MPVTKPGIELNEDGLCQGCYHNEMRAAIDYEERFDYLREICETHRREDGYYDCLIPVSGGKDSHYQTYVMKHELNMNPLLVAVKDPFTHTEAGKHNLRNLQDTFDCDLITAEIGIDTTRKMVRLAFEEYGSPTWAIDRAIYCVPIQVGLNFDIPLIVYGENTAWEYGGVLYDHDDDEPYSARDQIDNNVAKSIDWSFWLDNGVEEQDLNLMQYPSRDQIEESGLEPIYLSYFRPWDGHYNYETARKYGFQTLQHEWNREGFIEDYDQIDSIGYILHTWMKYPKMGYMRATDIVGYRRRSEHFGIGTQEGVEIIREHDHRLDERILGDFLDFTGYSAREFWEVVESHRNKDIFDESFTDGPIPRPIDDFENIDEVN